MNLDFEYKNAVHNLEKRFNFEKKEDPKFDFFKLERSLKLMELLEYPNKSNALTIHIAGTNGKGSVSSLLTSVLSLNYKVGLYSSPHLYEYTERIKINKKNISKKDFVNIYNLVEKKVLEYEKLSAKAFSFFEVLTVMSFIFFKKNKVDVNIIETGIGGTYDTTNVIKSDIQVITPISYDHQNVLGNTIKSIAENKAGIIKENSIVVTSKQLDETLEIIKEKSFEKKSKFIMLNYSLKSKPIIKNLKMNSLIEIDKNEYNISSDSVGGHYIDNIALAISTLNNINGLKITKYQIEKGIRDNSWPCRGNIKKFKDRVFFIDGAHNESGFNKLELSIEEFLNKNFTLIFGININHDIYPVINLIKKFKCKIIISKSAHPKSENIENIEKKLKYNKIDYIKSKNSEEALNIFLEGSKKDETVVVAGSIFIAAEISKLIKNE
tara:strand:- start:9012 stop:10325 length:1314 start_codon:yes stop_codon:yes gene_type:complete